MKRQSDGSLRLSMLPSENGNSITDKTSGVAVSTTKAVSGKEKYQRAVDMATKDGL